LPKFKIKSRKNGELLISFIKRWEDFFNSLLEISLAITLNSVREEDIALIINELVDVLNIFLRSILNTNL